MTSSIIFIVGLGLGAHLGRESWQFTLRAGASYVVFLSLILEQVK
jgi:hypothetical protein